MVPTALKWSDGVKLMVTTHFDLISGPLRVPRGPKGVILAQSLNFHVPILRWSHLFLAMITLTIEEILKIISHMSSYTKALPTLRRPRLA